MLNIPFQNDLGILGTSTFGRPSFESLWYDIAAQDRKVLTIIHDLNEYPVKVDVQVKIENNGQDYIFTGLASAQADDDVSAPYGAVVYTYNHKEVIISVPLVSNALIVGGIAYTGELQ